MWEALSTGKGEAMYSMLLLLVLSVFAVVSVSGSVARSPKIFIYSLPEKYHNMTQFGNEVTSVANFYALDYVFPTLLKDSPHVTTEPEEADFFYVRALFSHACMSWERMQRHTHTWLGAPCACIKVIS